ETGDAIGQFNYGLDLLRGHGVARDPIRGRQWVDRAAAQGLDTAQELQSSGYDPESVTPDADRWKYDADGKVF
ncbi:MAG: sel1 repeat family protein, partial [Pseudomonadota bacterium]